MQRPPDAASDTKLGRLEALVTQTGLPMEEAVPLFAAMLSIPTDNRYPPLALTPQRQKDWTLELFAQGLVNLARQEPVLVLFEDVHWSDPTSLEALDRVIDQIVASTDGIPLFVEELTKHVLESEWLTEAGDAYTLTRSLPPLAIPSTLHDSLMARLDRFASLKQVVQLGAAIGREFSYPVLAAASPLSEAELQEALGQLRDAHLVSQRGQVPEVTYSFKHTLIRDTAYQSLLRRDRQHAHQRIAQVLEAQFAELVETQPTLVGYYALHGELWDRALRYYS